jgi:RNA polymerase sigma-70 factor (ECF subfamily)
MPQCALAKRTAAPLPADTASQRRAAALAEYRTSAEAANAAERAVVEMHIEHRSALFGFLLTLTGDRHRAEDLVQETMVRAWRHRETVDGSHASALPWLLTISRRLAIDAHRARMARPHEVSAEELLNTAPPDDAIERNLTALDVREAVRNLHPTQREVLVERYFHGLSVAEIAEKLDIPEGTVKSRCYYALRSLRKTLRSYGRPLAANAG